MIDFIINPLAGKKNGKRQKKITKILEKILSEKKVPYIFHTPTSAEETKRITAKAIKDGATTIVCVGGDGTLHQVINGFSNFDKVTLGLIPCGTGNDFASAIKLPLDITKCVDIILQGNEQYVDYMQMPTVRGMNVIGMGIDVDVLNRYSALKKKTKWGYTKCLIKTLMNFDYVEFEAQVNGKREQYRSFIACIANGHQFGGGIPISPNSSATDNKLNFLAVSEIKRSKLISAFLKLKKGKILTFPETTHMETKRVKIFANGDYVVNVDGELYKNVPFDVKIVSNKLKMLLPLEEQTIEQATEIGEPTAIPTATEQVTAEEVSVEDASN